MIARSYREQNVHLAMHWLGPSLSEDEIPDKRIQGNTIPASVRTAGSYKYSNIPDATTNTGQHYSC